MDSPPTKPAPSPFDPILFIGVAALLAFGVVMIFSASGVIAAQKMGGSGHFALRQTIYGLFGVVVMLVASRIDYHFYKPLAWPMLVASIAGLVICLTPLGLRINGAARWIGVGPITIQPAEALKVTIVLWLAYSLSKKSAKIKSFSIGFLPHLIVPGLAIILCLKQPDFGTSVVVVLVTFSLLFVAGAKLGYILLAGLSALGVGYALVAGSEYRLKRILAFLDPLSDRFDDGYQLSQSMFGFASGGIGGVGLGDGLQKFYFLPEAHNDFIGAIIGEELGVVGVWLTMIVFAVVVARGIRAAMRAPDELGTYAAFGLSTLIAVQTLANLGVSMGLLPTKGLNLPFVSYGGSALVISLFGVGVLLNISRQGGTVAAQPGEEEAARSAAGNLRRAQSEARAAEGTA